MFDNFHRLTCLTVVVLLTACASPAAPSDLTPLPFADAFDQPSGWETQSDAAGEAIYVNGRFRIRVKQPKLTQWSRAGKRFADASVEVTAEALAGPKDNGFGLLFRCVDQRNCYHFGISSDGFWRAGVLRDNRWNTWGPWMADAAIRTGGVTNTLRVDMKGGSLSFFVNGKAVGQHDDATFSRGDIGLFAQTLNVSGADVAFDNLRVSALKP